MSKHTPGPWEYVSEDPGGPEEDYAPALVYVEESNVVLAYAAEDVDAETNEANLILMAAAPELLEAAEAAADRLGDECAHVFKIREGSDHSESCEESIVVLDLRAAIAKAKGESE